VNQRAQEKEGALVFLEKAGPKFGKEVNDGIERVGDRRYPD